MKLIVDTMGADLGCAELTQGIVLAVGRLDIDAIAVGDREIIAPIVKAAGLEDRITVVHAPDYVTMDDDPVCVRREKSNSSLVRAMQLLNQKEGDAVVTAGNTGAVITAATLYAQRIKGIRRAALAPVLPFSEKGIVLLDCGANVVCTPEYLLQFAYMGSFYAKQALGIESPRVALLNNGTEEHKGDALHVETYQLLKAAGEAGRLNFVGNIESRNVPLGHADVVVADGFSGNVMLKAFEGMGLFFAGALKTSLLRSLRTKLGALLVKPALSEIKKKMNYKEVGGSPLIGIAGPVIKAHGSSDAFAFSNAIGQAVTFAQGGVVEKISSNIAHLQVPAPEKTEK